MSDSLKIYASADVLAFVSARAGETKLGQRVQTVSSLENLSESTAKYVVLGIPEDIGVRANNGLGGADSAWIPAITAFLNIQSNDYLTGTEVAALGHFDIEEPADNSLVGLRNKVKEIDALVANVIQKIVAAGKVPIVIGGGHNNAYPLLMGISLAKNTPVNSVNIDAHADLRLVDEGRHSGNGFSTAIANGYLTIYRIFGLHQNYNNQFTLDTIADNKNIDALFFEELPDEPTSRKTVWTRFIADLPEPCSLELDLDSVQSILSSAATPSGITLNEVRSMVRHPGRIFNCFHICEGAVALIDGRTDASTGKSIAYLMSDFIKGQNSISS